MQCSFEFREHSVLRSAKLALICDEQDLYLSALSCA